MKFNYNKARELLKPGNWDSFLNRNNDFCNHVTLGKCSGYCRLVRGNVKKNDSMYNQFYMCLGMIDRDITFDLTIKPNNKGKAEVLDESFLWPYNYEANKDCFKKYKAIMADLIKLEIVTLDNEKERVYSKGE